MSKMIILFSLFFCAITASAQETNYEKLKTLFVAGTLPNLTPVSGRIASGRCFLPNNPNRPWAAYLTADRFTEDAGPIGDSTTSYTAIFQFNQSVDPKYYDSPSITPRDPVISDWRFKAELYDKNTYLLRYTSSNESVYLRASGSYIIAISYDGTGVEESVCYFFKLH